MLAEMQKQKAPTLLSGRSGLLISKRYQSSLRRTERFTPMKPQPSPPPIVLSTHARALLQGEYGDARIRPCPQCAAVARVEPFHHLPVPVGQRTLRWHVHVLKGDAGGEHGRPPVVHLYVGGKLQIGDVQPARSLNREDQIRLRASSSPTRMKSGCSCRMLAGTSGVTGPKKAFLTISALPTPLTTISTLRACMMVRMPMV